MKKLFKLLLIGVLAVVSACCFAACGTNPDNGGSTGGEQHVHNYKATAWFDSDNTFVKEETCQNDGCSQKTITKSAIEVSTAEQLTYLSNKMSEEVDLGTRTISFVNDIDMSGKAFTPIVLGEFDKYTFTGKEGGVVISNIAVENVEYSGFFGTVKGELSVENITLQNATFNGSKYAGGFIGNIEAVKNVTVKNCSVKNSEIIGEEAVGGMYGYATVGDNAETQLYIKFLSVTLEGNTVKGNGFAGACFGVAADADKGKMVATVETCVIKNNTIQSNCEEAENKSVGIVIGKIGHSRVEIIEDSTIENNTVKYGETVLDSARPYGRTGCSEGYNSTVAGGMKWQAGEIFSMGADKIVN